MNGNQNDRSPAIPKNPSLVTSPLTDRKFCLPRLAPEFYRGDAAIHWTLTVFDRKTGWLTESFHRQFRELMLHAAAREGIFCPIYCLMPDHLHLLWLGLRRDTDQRNGMSFLRTHLKPLLSPCKFQPQAYDHVLRQEERLRDAFAKICFYISANPVRSGLIVESAKWPFCGAIIPGYPDLDTSEEDFWPLFWKLFQQFHQPDAGNRKLPPRQS